MPSCIVNNAPLHYQQSGSGHALVLLHGFPLDSRMWAAEVESLSDRYRVIAPDMPGFGTSHSIAEATMDSYAQAIRDLLRQLNALPCVLAGLSMGGYVALAFERHFSSDLRGLMLIDTRAEADAPAGRENRNRMIQLVREQGAKAIADEMLPKLIWEQNAKQRPEIAAELRKIMESQTPGTIAASLAAMRDRDDQITHLPAIETPTLVIVGEHDVITPPAISEQMCKQLRNPTLAKIRYAGHMSPMEQPEDVTLAMRRFLEAVWA